MKRYIKSATNNQDTIIIRTYEDMEAFTYADHPSYYTPSGYLRFTKVPVDVPTDEELLKLYESYPNFLYHLRGLATTASYKKLKERLSKLIKYYDGEYFRAPEDKIDELAAVILQNRDKAPYNISIETRPTSVYVYIKLSKREAQNLDVDEYRANIQDYIDFLESLPEVGRISNKGALTYPLDRNEKPYLPLSVEPAANI